MPGLCPHLIKYEIGHGETFLLDHCSSCNGVWFDRNEWQTPKGDKLHDKIHLIFTKPWQSEIRREAARLHFESLYESRFGTADYLELKRVREWIGNHPKRDAVLAFLDDPDPYST
jgi:Zn-finger nucleic acid-binding protein